MAVAVTLGAVSVRCSATSSLSQGVRSGSSSVRWLRYEDPLGLFSTELPATWKYQRFRLDAFPSYPIERGVIFADANSPILPAVAKSADDPNALGNALQDATELYIWINVGRSTLGATPEQVALSEQGKASDRHARTDPLTR